MQKPDVATQKAQGYSCEEQQSMTLNSEYTRKVPPHHLFNVAPPCWLLTIGGGEKTKYLPFVTIRHINHLVSHACFAGSSVLGRC